MRGQLTILGLIMGFLTIVVFIGLLPSLTNTINSQLGIMDDFTKTIVGLFIPFIAIAIIVSFWSYVQPRREERY
jgi:predicted Kef-type K+ transport protein